MRHCDCETLSSFFSIPLLLNFISCMTTGMQLQVRVGYVPLSHQDLPKDMKMIEKQKQSTTTDLRIIQEDC